MRVEHELVDDPGPLLRPTHVAGAVTRSQHGAEALAGDRRVVDLAGCDRRQRLVEPTESFPRASLGHQRESAVGERPDLEPDVAELARDGQGAVGAALQVVDVRTVARHERELEVAGLDTGTDLVDQSLRALQPSRGNRPVVE